MLNDRNLDTVERERERELYFRKNYNNLIKNIDKIRSNKKIALLNMKKINKDSKYILYLDTG